MIIFPIVLLKWIWNDLKPFVPKNARIFIWGILEVRSSPKENWPGPLLMRKGKSRMEEATEEALASSSQELKEKA